MRTAPRPTGLPTLGTELLVYAATLIVAIAASAIHPWGLAPQPSEPQPWISNSPAANNSAPSTEAHESREPGASANTPSMSSPTPTKQARRLAREQAGAGVLSAVSPSPCSRHLQASTSVPC